mmetsp:Transcript_44405/g.95328  ORF Transcript_44405/g.95328 Transcript_44405/m.95328 type:complete len:225 (-) Transcript_44405:1212-1886(-)
MAASTSGSFSSSSSSAVGTASAAGAPTLAAATACPPSASATTSAATSAAGGSSLPRPKAALPLHQPKRTTSAVRSSCVPFSKALATRFSAALSSLPPSLKVCCTILTASLSEITSQIPSEAKMTNSSSSQSTSWMVISGSALTMSGFLKSLSPMALDTARPTIGEIRFLGSIHLQTLPISATPPPAASMRFLSSGRFGLWSWVSLIAPPPTRPTTARESPTLAM